MFRQPTIERGLSGTVKKQLIKRRLLVKTLRINARNGYETVDFALNGRKVKGAYVLVKTFAGEPILTYRRFYGKGPEGETSENFVESLNSEYIQTKNGVVNVDAGALEYIYIAQPKEIGYPVIRYNGYEGGFLAPRTVSITDNTTGQTSDYYLFQSLHDNLGDTSIELS